MISVCTSDKVCASNRKVGGVLGKEKLEQVEEFNYPGTFLSKHGEMERQMSKGVVKAECLIRAFPRAMKGISFNKGEERLTKCYSFIITVKWISQKYVL